MKVKDLIKLLEQCNPESAITSSQCRWFERKFYYPVKLDYLQHNDETMHQVESTPAEANLILIHY